MLNFVECLNLKRSAVFVMCFVSMLFSTSCQKKMEESLPNLKGTKWKVEGIWYEESGIFYTPNADCDECYLLTFYTDTTAIGCTYWGNICLSFSEKIVESMCFDRCVKCSSSHYYEDDDGIYRWDAFLDRYGLYIRHLLFWPYSITDTEMKLFCPEPLGIMDWEGLGIERPFRSFNSYYLFKKVK